WHSLQALLHGGRRWRGEIARDRGYAGQGRCVRRGGTAEGAVALFPLPERDVGVARRAARKVRITVDDQREPFSAGEGLVAFAARPRLSLPFQPHLGDRLARKLIGTLVQIVPGMTLDPMPLDVV